MALYDPKEFPNEVETTTDFTLADVLACARTKPADEAYDYWDTHNCACGQYAKHIGAVPGTGVRPRIEELFTAYAFDFPHTFGTFADRLEQAMSR